MFGLFKMTALRRWTVFFTILDVCFLLAGIFVMIIAFMWRGVLSRPPQPSGDVILRLAVTPNILNAGIVFSVAVFITVLASLWPLTTKPTQDDAGTKSLIGFLAVLLNTTLITVGIGTGIWLTTLREKARFLPVWKEQTVEIQTFIQDTLSCCGWFNVTTAGLFTSNLQTGFCANPISLPVDPDPNVNMGCERAFVKKADYILNNVFTTMYGFVVIQVLLILVGATVYNLRLQEKRFLRIDLKMAGGKGGFV